MGIVTIECPRTRRRVSTGVEMDAAAFTALRPTVKRFRCPACLSEHAWSKALAELEEIAPTRPVTSARPAAAQPQRPPAAASAQTGDAVRPLSFRQVGALMSKIAPKGWSGRRPPN